MSGIKKESSKNYTRGGVPLHELLFTLKKYAVKKGSFAVLIIEGFGKNVKQIFLAKAIVLR